MGDIGWQHWQQWLLFAISIIVALIAHIAKETRKELSELRSKVIDLSTRVEGTRISERHIEAAIQAILRTVEQIDSKLDHKVDKSDCLRLHPRHSEIAHRIAKEERGDD